MSAPGLYGFVVGGLLAFQAIGPAVALPVTPVGTVGLAVVLTSNVANPPLGRAVLTVVVPPASENRRVCVLIEGPRQFVTRSCWATAAQGPVTAFELMLSVVGTYAVTTELYRAGNTPVARVRAFTVIGGWEV